MNTYSGYKNVKKGNFELETRLKNLRGNCNIYCIIYVNYALFLFDACKKD